MSGNPFWIMNTCAEFQENINSLCVDRKEELSICFQSLNLKHHNVLLYGTRGVGKTFLVRLLEGHIKQKSPETFAAYIRIAGLRAYGNIDIVASFSRATLMQLCCVIWTDLLGKSYLDLRDRLNETGQEIVLRSKPEKIIHRIYTHLMTSHIKAQQQMINTIGFTAGVKGEKKESITREVQQSDILPFEFAEFAHEIKENVLKPLGRKRIIILCDEVNHMPIFQQEAILERYFDLFSSKQIQFLFVAGFMHWDTEMPVPSCFETQVHLQGFSNKSYVKELINKLSVKDILFDDSSIDILYDYFKGHPRLTIQACALAYDHVSEDTNHLVDGALMSQICRQIELDIKKKEKFFRNKC